MKVRVVGFQDMDFSATDGKKIDGVKLHFCFFSDKVDGQSVDSRFLSRKLCNGIDFSDLVGTDVNLEFDMHGKLVDLNANV